MTELRSWRIVLGYSLVVLVLTTPLVGQDLPTAKPEDVGISSAKVEELSKFMQSLVDQGKIAGGVTMMARHGKVIHWKPVGMADRDEKKPMQTDAIFRIASMTKPITSVAVMMLYDQGKLHLDDLVSKYIPEFKNPKVLVTVDPLKTEPAKREITIRHLLTHTSGLGYNSTDKIGPIYDQTGIISGISGSEVTLETMMKKLGQLPITFHPGEQWQYSLSIDVLGRIVEVVSGVTLDRFIQDQLCRPLGMRDTFFIVPPDKRHRLVPAYLPIEDRLRKLPEGEKLTYLKTPISADYHLDSNKYRSGGGGLCSTAPDYMRICQMLLNGGELNGVRLLQSETVCMMTGNQVGKLSDGFGLGFGVIPDKEDIHKQLRGSYAWGGFWSTSFRISPRGDWIYVAMSQAAWDGKSAPAWAPDYEKIAADSIQE